MAELDPASGAASRYAATTVEHFQHPRNVGRLSGANATGRVDDPVHDATLTIYLRVEEGRVHGATFRAFACSACIAACSMVTEMLIGRTAADARSLRPESLDRALGGLPDDKRYCADHAVLAVQRALESAPAARS